MKPLVLITGAGSGLGRGLSLGLARSGHPIIATDLRLEGAQETAAQIRREDGEAQAYALDVTSEEDVARLFHEIEDRAVGVLINNAGLQHVAAVQDFPVAKWDQLLGVMHLKRQPASTRSMTDRRRASSSCAVP